MAINFPNSPTNGQLFIDGSSGNRWTWDSGNTCWVSTSTFTQTITVSTTQPGSPVVGQLWWNQDYGRLLVYYNDGTSYQWVDASPSDSYGIVAYSQSNSSYAVANVAFDTANAAFASANNVAPQVTPAFNTANLAYAAANTALQNTNITVAGNLKSNGAMSLVRMPFYEATANINFDYTINTGMNAFTPGPVAIANGVFVTIPDGSYWSVT